MSETQRERLLRARARLVTLLDDIAAGAAAQALTRCPYRTRADICTFRGECRNQLSTPHSPRGCAGGRLDPRPASAQEIAAAADAAGAPDVARKNQQ